MIRLYWYAKISFIVYQFFQATHPNAMLIVALAGRGRSFSMTKIAAIFSVFCDVAIMLIC